MIAWHVVNVDGNLEIKTFIVNKCDELEPTSEPIIDESYGYVRYFRHVKSGKSALWRYTDIEEIEDDTLYLADTDILDINYEAEN